MTLDERKKAFDQISRELAIIRLDLEQHQGINDLSLNIHSENYFRDLFNFMYGANFENANLEHPNEPYKDLVDHQQKKLVQITTTRSKEKILHSLNALKESNYQGYSLTIYFLLDKANPNSITTAEIEYEYGIKLNDILRDHSDLIRDIQNLESNRLITLAERYFSRTSTHDSSKGISDKLILHILDNIRNRKNTNANSTINTLKIIYQHNAKAQCLLELLELRLQLNPYSTLIHNEPYKLINAFKADFELTSIEQDLCDDLILRIDARKDSTTDSAKRFYNSLTLPGFLAQEAYYEILAIQEEIDDVYTKITSSDEILLTSIVRGYIRTLHLKSLEKATKRLLTINSSLNSRILWAYANHLLLESEIKTSSYWSVTNTVKNKLLNQAKELVSLINECEGEDKRCFSIAIPLLHFLRFEYEDLTNCCWHYIETIEEIDKQTASIMRKLFSHNSENDDEIFSSFKKAHQDSDYRKQTIENIQNEKTISVEDSLFLNQFGHSEEIQKWLENGGNIQTNDPFIEALATIELKATAAMEKQPARKPAFKAEVKEFIENYKDKFKAVVPERMLALSKKLNDCDLPEISCLLLQTILPKEDLWPSPLVKSYINCLLASKKDHTLETILNNIIDDERDGYIWHCKATLLHVQRNIAEAKNAILKSLNLTPNSAQAWCLAVQLYKEMNFDNQEIKNLLAQVPDDIFEKQSDHALTLLYELTFCDAFIQAERYILKWFFEEPENASKILSDYYFNAICFKRIDIIPSSEVFGCIGAYRYRKGKKEEIKLICKDIESSKSNFLPYTSPLAKELISAELNKPFQSVIGEVEVIEILPPFVGALRIALSLRDSQNDGTDSFRVLELSSDPTELIKDIEQQLITSNKNSKEGEIINNPQIPMFMKGRYLKPTDPLMGALQYFTLPKSFSDLLANFGEDSPCEMILDVFSIAYLGLTGLFEPLTKSTGCFFITLETKHCLRIWLDTINDPEYTTISAAPESGIQINNYEKIQQRTKEIRLFVNWCLENCTVAIPNTVDVPEELMLIHDSIDISAFSSLILSAANNIPWLCLDSLFAQLSTQSGNKIVNAQSLFLIMGQQIEFESKKGGLYYHSIRTLPYALSYDDILMMSQSDESESNYFLSELLEHSQLHFQDFQHSAQFFHLVLIQVLGKAFMNNQIANGHIESTPEKYDYTTKIFNLINQYIIQYTDERDSESKLSLLIFNLLISFQEIPTIVQYINNIFLEFIKYNSLDLNKVKTQINDLYQAHFKRNTQGEI